MAYRSLTDRVKEREQESQSGNPPASPFKAREGNRLLKKIQTGFQPEPESAAPPAAPAAPQPNQLLNHVQRGQQGPPRAAPRMMAKIMKQIREAKRTTQRR